MPLYDYECENCSHKLLDVRQSFNDKPLSFCPECKEPKLYRVITGGVHAFVAGSNTIGSLADKNAKKHKGQINEMQAMKSENTPKAEKPFYQGSATNKEISKMSDKQKQNYIMKGEK